jgi:hypothetical protein
LFDDLLVTLDLDPEENSVAPKDTAPRTASATENLSEYTKDLFSKKNRKEKYWTPSQNSLNSVFSGRKKKQLKIHFKVARKRNMTITQKRKLLAEKAEGYKENHHSTEAQTRN